VLLYTVKEKGGKPDRKPHPVHYGLRYPNRNLKIMPRNLKKIVRSWFRLLEQLLQDINTSKSDCRSTLYNEQTLFFRDFLRSISQTTDCEQLQSIRDFYYLDTVTLGQGNWLLNRFCLLSNSLETSTLVTGRAISIFWQQNWHSYSEASAEESLWRHQR
jgi:hypothetical protein